MQYRRYVEIERDITITTAFHNSQQHLSRYLECLTSLDYPCGQMNLLWADNASEDHTKQILSAFVKKHGSKYNSVLLFDVQRLAYGNKDSQIANVMNALFEHAQTDIINIDSDIVAPSNSVHTLLSVQKRHGANVCSGITTFIIPHANKLIPVINAFTFDSQNHSFINIASRYLDETGKLRLPFMETEVDACGFGLCLIEIKVIKQLKCSIDSGTAISSTENTAPCMDIRFCMDARSLGYRIMIDTSLYFQHPTLHHEVHTCENAIVAKCLWRTGTRELLR